MRGFAVFLLFVASCTLAGAQTKQFYPHAALTLNSNAAIYGACVIRDTAYFVGKFDTVLNMPRKNAAAVDLSTMTLLPFNPAIEGVSSAPGLMYGKYMDLVASGDYLYLAGAIVKIGGVTRTGVFKINRYTGTIDTLKFVQHPYLDKIHLSANNRYLVLSASFLGASYPGKTGLKLNGTNIPERFAVYDLLADTLCKPQWPGGKGTDSANGIYGYLQDYHQINNNKLYYIKTKYIDTATKKVLKITSHVLDLGTMKMTEINIQPDINIASSTMDAQGFWFYGKKYPQGSKWLYRYDIGTNTLKEFDDRFFDCWDQIGTPGIAWQITGMHLDEGELYFGGNMCGVREGTADWKYLNVLGKLNPDYSFTAAYNRSPMAFIKNGQYMYMNLGLWGGQNYMLTNIRAFDVSRPVFRVPNRGLNSVVVFARKNTFFTIEGETLVAKNDTFSYATEDRPHTSYQWRVSGGSIYRGQGTHLAGIQWHDTTGYVHLTAVDSNAVMFTDSVLLYVHGRKAAAGRSLQQAQGIRVVPVSDQAYAIRWEPGLVPVSVQVLDHSGRLVADLSGSISQNEFIYRPERLRAGVHYIRLTTGDDRSFTCAWMKAE